MGGGRPVLVVVARVVVIAVFKVLREYAVEEPVFLASAHHLYATIVQRCWHHFNIGWFPTVDVGLCCSARLLHGWSLCMTA